MARKAVALVLPALFSAIGLLSTDLAPAAVSTCSDVDAPVAQLTTEQFESSVFCLVNVRRAENARRQLRPNPLLQVAAVDYANSMMAGRFFSHYGDFAGHENSSNPVARLRQKRYVRPGYVWMVGEDLRWATPETSTPEQIVQAWMDSPVHRFWLLKPKFDELGVAAIRGTPIDPDLPDGVTVAAEFGFRRD